MRLRFLLLALGVAGCASPPAYLQDHALKAAGDWTAQDARVRALIDSRYRDDPRYLMSKVTGEAPLPMPVRRRTTGEQILGRVGDSGPSYPSPSAIGAKLLGVGWEPTYVLRGERNAIIILNPGEPATVVAIDPAKPITWPSDETPEVAYQMLRRELACDRENLRDTDP